MILADRRVFWTDELSTFYLAKLPKASMLWEALADGPDTLPPLGFYATRLSIQLFGEVHIAARLPAILGFWSMCVGVFLFVRRYASTAFAGVAMLSPLSTMAYSYAYEARPYGLMMGFGTVVLLCWQRVCEGRHRIWWQLGMATSLAAALASHWYAILILIPLGLGEAVRVFCRRRPDYSTWAALALGLASLGAYLPLIRHARTFRTEMAGGIVGPLAVFATYQQLLQGGVLLFLALLLVLAWLAPKSLAGVANDQTPDLLRIPVEVMAAIVGFLLLPVFGAILATFVTGAFNTRYLLLAETGFAIGIGLATHRLAGGCRWTGGIVLTIAAVFGLFRIYESKIGLRERSAIREKTSVFSILRCPLAMADSPDPIVVPDVHTYYTLRHYAPSPLAERLVYLTEYDAIASRMSRGLKSWTPWRIEEYKDFTGRHAQFLLFDYSYFEEHSKSPLLPRLIQEGAKISDSGCLDTRDIYPRPGSLYRVTLPPKTQTSTTKSSDFSSVPE